MMQLNISPQMPNGDHLIVLLNAERKEVIDGTIDHEDAMALVDAMGLPVMYDRGKFNGWHGWVPDGFDDTFGQERSPQ